MMLSTSVVVTLSILAGQALAKSGKCHGQRLYCGSSLKNLGWSDDDIWAGIHKGNQWYPGGLSNAQLPMTLFECDGRSGDDALWWRSACADLGCHDAGAGHSDYCQ